MKSSTAYSLNIIVGELLYGAWSSKSLIKLCVVLTQKVVVIFTPGIQGTLLGNSHTKGSRELNIHNLNETEIHLNLLEVLRVFDIIPLGQKAEPVLASR